MSLVHSMYLMRYFTNFGAPGVLVPLYLAKKRFIAMVLDITCSITTLSIICATPHRALRAYTVLESR